MRTPRTVTASETQWGHPEPQQHAVCDSRAIPPEGPPGHPWSIHLHSNLTGSFV